MKRRAKAKPAWCFPFPFVVGVFCICAPNLLIAADTKVFEGQSILDNSLDVNGLQIDDRGRVRLEKTASGNKPNGEVVFQAIEVDRTRKYRLDWIEQWTTPQTWSKYRRNPIFGPKQTGKWDNWTNGVSVVQEKNGKRLKMFYSGKEGGGIGFATGLTSDPTYWREHPSSPVLRPRLNWEGNKINQPRVVKVTDQHWRMYYTGWGYEHPNGGTKWAFNLAESFDGGTTWARHDVGPLMERGDRGSPDGGGIFVPEDKASQWKVDDVVHRSKNRQKTTNPRLPSDFR